MYSIKHQRGVATVLLVILLGITVMMITAAVAKNIGSRKEATVAAHAQTNAQIMAWAGVSAFQQYVIEQGKLGVQKIKDLPAQGPIRFKSAPNDIVARDITVSGACTVNGNHCTVSANISANNIPAKAATTINVVFDMVVKDGTVEVVQQKNILNLGGNTTFSGNTMIAAPAPPPDGKKAELTINASGYLVLNSGFKTSNIDVININSTGDVIIECGVASQCGNTVINITTQGRIEVRGGDNNFGVLKSGKKVLVSSGAETKDIAAKGKVTVLDLSTVNGDIESFDEVSVSGTGAVVTGNINALKDVTVYTGAKINTSKVSQSAITSAGSVTISPGSPTINGDINAKGFVNVSASTVIGDVYSGGLSKCYSAAAVAKVNVCNDASSKITGIVYLPSDGSYGGLGSKSDVVYGLPAGKPLTPTFKTLSLSDAFASTQFDNHVDVNAYLNEANYIFLQSNATQYHIHGIYLNKVRNEGNGITYVADCTSGKPIVCTQSKVDSAGNKTLINNQGFRLGDYMLSGTQYTGAICEIIDTTTKKCTSEIVGFLPRISVQRVGASNRADEYGFGDVINRWRLRSLSNDSGIDNAAFAPGVMFFEGDLELAGNSSSNTGSAFVNSFLATGNIWSIAYSPAIYSPYTVPSTKIDSAVCDRTIKKKDGTSFTISNISPKLLSEKYPRPINICKDENTFSNSMDKDVNGQKILLDIDNTKVAKQDLGRVALMANGNIDIGSCSIIYGNVLARGNLTRSTACGTRDDPNASAINGEITTVGTGDTTDRIETRFLSGTKINVPNLANGDGADNVPKQGQIIDPNSITIKWTKAL